MSIGIGLGAFMGSFEKGYGLGKQMCADYDDNKQRKELQGIRDKGQQEFQEGVKAGKFNADGFLEYDNQYIRPQITEALAKRGDYNAIENFNKYYDSESGRKYRSTFGETVLHYQMGNHEGVVNGVNALLKQRGDKGKITFFEGDDVYPAAYRYKGVREDGSPYSVSYSLDKGKDVLIALGNTWEAYRDHTTQTNKNVAKAPGLLGGISMGQGQQGWDSLSQADKRKIYTEERKFLADNDPDFLSRSPEEQDKLIRQGISRSFSAPGIVGGNGAQVLIDTKTGQPVSPAPNQGGNGGEAGSQGQPTEQEQPARIEPKPVDSLILGAAPTNSEEAIAFAQKLKESGKSDRQIAYGLSASRLVDDESKLPEEWRSSAASQATDEEMDEMDATWGLTQRGRQRIEDERSKVDARTREGNRAIEKNAAIERFEKAIRNKSASTKEIIYKMEELGISIDDLPRDLQRIVRDGAPGMFERGWDGYKEYNGFGDKKVLNKDFAKQSDEELLERHANTEYVSNAAKEQHALETEILKQIEAGEIDQYHLKLKMRGMSNPSDEFRELVERALPRMPKDNSRGNQQFPHGIPGIGMGQNMPQGVIGIAPM